MLIQVVDRHTEQPVAFTAASVSGVQTLTVDISGLPARPYRVEIILQNGDTYEGEFDIE